MEHTLFYLVFNRDFLAHLVFLTDFNSLTAALMKPFFLQASEQYLTSAQLLAHFFRQLNGLPQAKQVLLGRSDFLIILHRLDKISTTRPNIVKFNISHFI